MEVRGPATSQRWEKHLILLFHLCPILAFEWWCSHDSLWTALNLRTVSNWKIWDHMRRLMELDYKYIINWIRNGWLKRKLCTIYSPRSSFSFCNFDQALGQQIAACRKTWGWNSSPGGRNSTESLACLSIGFHWCENHFCLSLHTISSSKLPNLVQPADQFGKKQWRHMSRYILVVADSEALQTSCWFQPSWNILVKFGSFPQVEMKIKRYYFKPPSSRIFQISWGLAFIRQCSKTLHLVLLICQFLPRANGRLSSNH